MFGKVKGQKLSREIGENERKYRAELYKETRSSMDREVLRSYQALNLTNATIEELSRGVHNKVTSMDREAI